MKLWPERMLKHLPTKLLIAQHKECCALRGRAWGRNNKNVNYVFDHAPYILEAYHFKVLNLLRGRHVKTTSAWRQKGYRGLREQPWAEVDLYGANYIYKQGVPYPTGAFYDEHDEAYWQVCRQYIKARKIEVEKKIPAKQPTKGKWTRKASCGGHLCACSSCGFSLISDEDPHCPRCKSSIDNKAQPEVVLIDPQSGDIYERKMMSADMLRLSNIVIKKSALIWRYISFSDRMRYRRWLGRRMKREDFQKGPSAEEVFQLMKSTRNLGRALSFLPSNMKTAEKKLAILMWRKSSEDGRINKAKGKVKS